MNKNDFEGIMQGLAEAKAFARGEDVPGVAVHVPEPAEQPVDPAIARVITALARRNARRDYAALHPDPKKKS